MKKEGRFLATVHDENNFSCPPKAMKEEMAIMKKAMEEIAFDVPMLSDGFTGKTWGALKAYKD
jgi:DNA polymerase I-like protein with 3'-5' exonuclease and polymerase domains